MNGQEKDGRLLIFRDLFDLQGNFKSINSWKFDVENEHVKGRTIGVSNLLKGFFSSSDDGDIVFR